MTVPSISKEVLALGNSSASGKNTDRETRKKQDAIIRKMQPLMTDLEFDGLDMENEFSSGVLKIAEPYPNADFLDLDLKGLVPKRFWEIKSKQRTYNGFSKVCDSCGIFCKCEVQILWEGPEIWKKIPTLFWNYWVTLKQSGRFFRKCGL